MNQTTRENPTGEVVCPFCGTADNELFSLFGQTLIGSQYYCNNCHTVFEAVRWYENRPEQDKEKDENGVQDAPLRSG
jgi:hypothetical protein